MTNLPMQLETRVIFAKKELQCVLNIDVAVLKSPPLHIGFQYLFEIGSVSISDEISGTEGRL